ncbi:BLUF domain-containing protein [uncultured Litoreibacter sp.]|uniref:BLUF domain-containing protein n=1 Tax=uncultured Litoreibacter sp. TaxID=1392394 RepID=UPI00262B2081|nr:BLUF domain-containing protein [uncultured Litoreibacter sp.]
MICVVYSSVASDFVDEEDVQKILTRAEVHNAKTGITGALVYDGRRFCQLLEGNDDAVTSMFDDIMKDARHGDIKVMAQMEVADRRFPGWAMLRVEEPEFQTMLEGLAIRPD